jgi:hypothetical protein
MNLLLSASAGVSCSPSSGRQHRMRRDRKQCCRGVCIASFVQRRNPLGAGQTPGGRSAASRSFCDARSQVLLGEAVCVLKRAPIGPGCAPFKIIILAGCMRLAFLPGRRSRTL